MSEPAFLTRIRLRAMREVHYIRSVWAAAAGLAISHSEVDRLLEPPARASRRNFCETDPAAREMTAAIAEADHAASTDIRLARLRSRFGLTEPEADLLSLCVAAEISPSLERVFGYINDETVRVGPSRALAERLFDWPCPIWIGADSGLVKFALAHPVTDGGQLWSSVNTWTADPFAVGVLCDGAAHDAALDGVIAFASQDVEQDACVYPDVLTKMTEFAEAAAASLSGGRIEIVLTGPDGAGKRTLAAQLLSQLGVPMLTVDAARLGTEPAAAVEQARRAARLALLLDHAVYWNHADAAPPAVWDALRDYPAQGIACLASAGKAPVCAPNAARRTFSLPGLTRASRIALYEHLSGECAPAAVAERILLPAQIAAAARVASAGSEAVAEACRPAGLSGAATLATPLPCPYTWDDFVAAPEIRGHLEEIEQQMRNRWPVYEEWGMQRLCPLGRGIAALFAGPSGTGKTMAAQVLAASCGMELWRVDLAGVVSKYIGETEKNLKQVFDAAELAHVLLFFDEADALFGKRTEVKDAHDRFANIEIDYLLQRMEQFDGLAILATNRKSDLDSAFLRRLRFIVDFMPPRVEERERLWRIALETPATKSDAGAPAATARKAKDDAPNAAPLGADINWRWLAENLNLTGAEIKSVALAAAFLARAQKTRIGMKQIAHAAKRELVKKDAPPRAGDFGEWD